MSDTFYGMVTVYKESVRLQNAALFSVSVSQNKIPHEILTKLLGYMTHLVVLQMCTTPDFVAVALFELHIKALLYLNIRSEVHI